MCQGIAMTSSEKYNFTAGMRMRVLFPSGHATLLQVSSHRFVRWERYADYWRNFVDMPDPIGSLPDISKWSEVDYVGRRFWFTVPAGWAVGCLIHQDRVIRNQVVSMITIGMGLAKQYKDQDVRKLLISSGVAHHRIPYLRRVR